jgi:hypothetical protein
MGKTKQPLKPQHEWPIAGESDAPVYRHNASGGSAAATKLRQAIQEGIEGTDQLTGEQADHLMRLLADALGSVTRRYWARHWIVKRHLQMPKAMLKSLGCLDTFPFFR